MIVAPAPLMAKEKRALDNVAGRRLARMLGMAHAEMLETCDTMYLSPRKWRFHEAAMRAERLRSVLTTLRGVYRYQWLLCCDHEVARVMGAPVLGVRGTEYVPHLAAVPDPTSSWWEEIEYRQQGEEFLGSVGEEMRGLWQE